VARKIPKVGDLVIYDYHRGRRVGILVSKTYKSHPRDICVPSYYENPYGIVWRIKWTPVGMEKMPSEHFTELSILNYLNSGKMEIYTLEKK